MRVDVRKRKTARDIREMREILQLWKSSCGKVSLEHRKFYAIIGPETDLSNCFFIG